MNLAHLLERIARHDADRPAIHLGTQVHATHGQWAARAAACALRLRQSGLQPGDRVVLFMRNHPRYLELMFAAWWAGLVVVPVNAKLHLREVAWIMDHARAQRMFVTRDVVPEGSTELPAGVFVTDVDSSAADVLLAPGFAGCVASMLTSSFAGVTMATVHVVGSNNKAEAKIAGITPAGLTLIGRWLDELS